MSKTVIKLENVSKTYQIYKTNAKRLIGIIFNKKGAITKKALVNVNLEIRKGEGVCIIGAVGSGRTTLLKVMSGITFPTSGKAHYKGKLDIMFDPKIGLVPDLTGRQNIRLKASIVGWTKDQINEHEQEIIEFAGIEGVADMPLRTYPKGSAARLGFAIHSTFKPDIFIMDESFAVGQREYRNKCLEKLKEIADDPEVTFICVSRNYLFARMFTNRGIVLNQGEIVFDGGLKEAMGFYKAMRAIKNENNEEEEMDDRMSEYEEDEDSFGL